MAYLFRYVFDWYRNLFIPKIHKKNKDKIMITKENEKEYKKPKLSKIWGLLIYGSAIAIGIFMSIYIIFINYLNK